MTRPLIQAWPDKYIKGITSVEGPHIDSKGKQFDPIMGELMPLDEALEQEFDTGALLTTYTVVEDGQATASPLIRKPALKSVRAYVDPEDDPDNPVKRDVVLTCIGVDIDTPGHAALTEDYLADFAMAIASLPAPFDKWHSWYTSRHGIRLFYALTEPMPVDEAEPRVTTFLKKLTEAGLVADMACKDWTRRFLLPKVVRDGTRTSQDALHSLTIASGSPTVDLKDFTKAPANLLARSISFERRDNYPSQEECANRLTETSPKGRQVASRFLVAAKKVLKAWPEYYEQLITQHDPLPDDEKHGYMLSMFGAIVPALIRKAGAKAEDIFALCYDPITAWDNCKSDPHANIWDALQHVYQIEAVKFNEEQQRKAEKVEEGLTHLQNMVRGMRTWCDAPEIAPEAGEEANTAYVMRHLFANIARQYYPLGPYGQYEQSAVAREQIITRIRTGYLDEIVATTTQEGTVSAEKIIDTHSTIVHDVEYLPQCESLGILRPDQPLAKLRLPMYRRNPHLKACYNAEVDGWLQAFFGEHYDVACRWIGYALAFEDGPICALSIMGPPDTGKKLLIEGLSECLESPFVIPGTAIDATHNESMLKSPFLHVNESWPMMRNHSSSADRFKQLTAGDAIHVNPKHKAVVQVKNPLRILVTANNHDALYDMTRGRNLRQSDREAIGQRLYHLDIDDSASQYLRALGGRAYTSRKGGRWIGGDSGEASDCIVARHFLWLYENRPELYKGGDNNDRLCVMGNCGTEGAEMFQMASQSDSLPIIMRGILHICQNSSVFVRDARIGKGQVLVTMCAVHRVITETLEERIKERTLEANIEALSKEGDPYVDSDGRYFTEINMDMVLSYAGRWGMDVKKIKEEIGK